MASAHQLLKIKDSVKDWRKHAGWGQGTQRKYYPFEHEPIPDAELMESFDMFMQAVSLAHATRSKYQKALTRFTMMFEAIDGSPLDYMNIVLNIARSELFEILPSLDILAPDCSWTMVIIFAVGYFANMQRLRFASEGNKLGADLIDAIIGAHLDPWRRAAATAQICVAAQSSSNPADVVEQDVSEDA